MTVAALFLLWSRSTGYDLVAACKRRWPLALVLGLATAAVFAPKVAAFGYLVVAVVAVLLARGDSTRQLTTTLLGVGFELVQTRREEHVTPGGSTQPFTWVAGRVLAKYASRCSTRHPALDPSQVAANPSPASCGAICRSV